MDDVARGRRTAWLRAERRFHVVDSEHRSAPRELDGNDEIDTLGNVSRGFAERKPIWRRIARAKSVPACALCF